MMMVMIIFKVLLKPLLNPFMRILLFLTFLYDNIVCFKKIWILFFLFIMDNQYFKMK